MQVHVLDDAETRTNPCAAVLQGILSKRVGKCALLVIASVPIHAAQRFHMTVVFVFLAGPQCASSLASGQLQSE